MNVEIYVWKCRPKQGRLLAETSSWIVSGQDKVQRIVGIDLPNRGFYYNNLALP